MTGLLIAGLVLAVMIFLIAMLMDRYAAFLYRLWVVDPLAAVREILSSGEPPARWRVRPLEALARRSPDSTFAQRARRLLNRWYAYRLARLVRSVETSTVIQSPEKEEYIEGLNEIRALWLEE